MVVYCTGPCARASTRDNIIITTVVMIPFQLSALGPRSYQKILLARLAPYCTGYVILLVTSGVMREFFVVTHVESRRRKNAGGAMFGRADGGS